MCAKNSVNIAAQKVQVNWANECILGTVLSALFTVMASNSTPFGMTDTGTARHLHDFIIMGGVSMSIFCWMSAMFLVMTQMLHGLYHQAIGAASPDPKVNRPVSAAQAMKFIKIFLP